MHPKKSVNDLEEALRESTPPKTAVPLHFRQQLRHDLLTLATPTAPGLSRGWLLAPAALLVVVIMVFWYGMPKTAVEPAIEINTTRPASTPAPSSTLSREEILQAALTFASRRDNKPIGGWLVEANVEAITTTAVLETWDVAVNRLGSFAVADFGGSNIFFPESHVETVWFVQLVGRWQPFGGTADRIEPSKYVGVLVYPDTGDVLAAGSSTVPFLTEPIILWLADYPPLERPYYVDHGDGFWLVHAGSQLLAFDPRSPYLPDLQPGEAWPDRCLYGWVMEPNGRFTDPCSGDEWELDGTLNLTESTELGNNRNLDQYRLEVDDDTIIVHLDEIIFGDAVDTDFVFGTATQPLTDFDTIIEQVTILGERRQANLATQTGWLHTSVEEIVPLEQRGNGVAWALFPTEKMVVDNWYHAVGDGRYDQSITRFFDANNNLTQAGILTDGHYINFTLNEISSAENDSYLLPNEATFVAQQLQEMATLTTNTPSARAYIVKENGRNHYHIHTATTQSEVFYIFDFDNGRLLSQEVTTITNTGERTLNYQTDQLLEEWRTSLPAAVAVLLEQGQSALNDPNNSFDGSFTWEPPTPMPNPNPLSVQASDNKYNITLSVIDMAYQNNEVVVTTLAQVASIWQMNANAFPPQQALSFGGSMLQNETGFLFAPTQAEGSQVEAGSETGGIRQATIHHFAGGAYEELVLETAVELTLLYRAITLPITLDDAEVGQIWSLDWPIPLGAAQLVLSEVVWEEETAAGTAQLRLTVVDNNPPDLILNCLHIATTDPWQKACSNDERSFVVTVPTDKPVQLHLRANIDVNGFELRWQP